MSIQKVTLKDVNVTVRREVDRDVVIIHCEPDPELSRIRGNFERAVLALKSECAAANIDSESVTDKSIDGDKV